MRNRITHRCMLDIAKKPSPKSAAGKIKEGDRFGRLVIAGPPFRLREGQSRTPRYVCQCDCGCVTVFCLYALLRPRVSASSPSCGCGTGESIALKNFRHGFARHGNRHPLYYVWRGIKCRCHSPRDRSYRYYGARGISMCNEWRDSADTFIGWAVANGWRKGLEVDRRDGTLGYSPENCRFVTKLENIATRDLSGRKRRALERAAKRSNA